MIQVMPPRRSQTLARSSVAPTPPWRPHRRRQVDRRAAAPCNGTGARGALRPSSPCRCVGIRVPIPGAPCPGQPPSRPPRRPHASEICHYVASKCHFHHGRFLVTPWLASLHLQTLFLGISGRPPLITHKR